MENYNKIVNMTIIRRVLTFELLLIEQTKHYKHLIM